MFKFGWNDNGQNFNLKILFYKWENDRGYYGNSTNWFNNTSCFLKTVGGVYFNYSIGEIYSVFMDILSFNFDNTSWIQFEDLSTLYPDEYSTSFDDLINLNGKELWVYFY